MRKQWWKRGKHFGRLLSEAVQSQFLCTGRCDGILTLQPCVRRGNHGIFPGLPLRWWPRYSVSWADAYKSSAQVWEQQAIFVWGISQKYTEQDDAAYAYVLKIGLDFFVTVVWNASSACYHRVSWVSCFPAQEFHTGLLSCWKCWHPLQLGEWSQFSHRMLFVTFWLAEAAWVTGRQPSTLCYDFVIATWIQSLPAGLKKIVVESISGWALSASHWQLYSTALCWPIELQSFATVIKWLAFHTSFWISTKWCTSSAVWLLHGWCHMKLLLSQCTFCVHHTTMYQFSVALFKAIYVGCMCV